MILYNFRYRGAFEYDKFTLNALQLNNKINFLLKNKTANSIESINAYDNDINKKLKAVQDRSANLYINLIEYWRC